MANDVAAALSGNAENTHTEKTMELQTFTYSTSHSLAHMISCSCTAAVHMSSF